MMKILKWLHKEMSWSAMIILPFVGMGICEAFNCTGFAYVMSVAGGFFGGWCLMMTTAKGGGLEWDGIDTYYPPYESESYKDEDRL